jgi:cation transport ATPase
MATIVINENSDKGRMLMSMIRAAQKSSDDAIVSIENDDVDAVLNSMPFAKTKMNKQQTPKRRYLRLCLVFFVAYIVLLALMFLNSKMEWIPILSGSWTSIVVIIASVSLLLIAAWFFFAYKGWKKLLLLIT